MCQGKEIEQIVAGSYARPTQLIDVAHPDVLHPGAAGVTEVHLQGSRPVCLPNLQFTTEKLEVHSCEPPAAEISFRRSFTTAQGEDLVCAPVKGSPSYSLSYSQHTQMHPSLTGQLLSKESAAYWCSK